ncbi:MAG: hypothetical protein M1370_00385 [Bacteroidetes bacterium]|nr:hypothetical protein [Bacteroidota bacterium]MCL5026087.1 hypothetical protein [Chloroflexota bacterium]
MPGSSGKPRAKGGEPANASKKRTFSPMIIAGVVVLALVIVGALAVVGLQAASSPAGGDRAGLAQGTSIGPADAKVVVLNFSDFR